MVKYVPAHRRLPLVGPMIDKAGASIRSIRKYRPEDVPYEFATNVLEISTNIGCTVNCYYCPQKLIIDRYLKTTRKTSTMMSMDDFQKYLRSVPAEVNLTFSGFSEPFLNPETTAMILLSHQGGHQVRIYTTLVGLDLDSYQKLKRIPFKEFVVHLPDLEGTSTIPITNEYLALLEAIAAEPPEGLRLVILGRNVDPRVSAVIEGRTHKVVLVPLTDRVGNLSISDIEVVRPRLKKGRIECVCRLRNNVLLPDGRVHLCFNDFGLKHEIGNLDEGSYGALFNSPAFRSVERSHSEAGNDSNCRRCTFSVRIR